MTERPMLTAWWRMTMRQVRERVSERFMLFDKCRRTLQQVKERVNEKQRKATGWASRSPIITFAAVLKKLTPSVLKQFLARARHSVDGE